jgi:cytochrome c-type biogenesis protein CcmF
MVTAHVSVERDGESIGGMYPARWYFRGKEGEPTTEVAIRRSVPDDLYLVLAAFEVDTQLSTLEVTVNPMINWIWLGFGVMAFGTILSLLPERAMAFAKASVPEGAVTTSVLLLFLVGGFSTHAHAQHVENPQVVMLVPRTPVEKQLRDTIICMCGTCGRKRVGECTCGEADLMRKEIAALVAEGKTYDEVVDYFVSKWGSQEVLSAPIDEGFNRLAWFLPYAVGLVGIVVVGGVAVRWSRKTGPAPVASTGAPPATAEEVAAVQQREERLDDELRDLD